MRQNRNWSLSAEQRNAKPLDVTLAAGPERH